MIRGPFGFLIRPPRLDDIEALVKTHIRVWRETYPGLVPQPYLDSMDAEVPARRARLEARIAAPPPGFSEFVLTRDEIVLGLSGCGPARDAALDAGGEVYAINIANAAKGHGAGAAMMAAMARALIAGGHQAAGLWVVQGNAPAVRFYERLGGVRRASREDAIGGAPVPEYGYRWESPSLLDRSAAAIAAAKGWQL
jgi:ribosomal protein S18 acetylase RimI-like enzyme